MVNDGAHITYAAFSPCTESVPEGFSQYAIRNEFVQSCTSMDVHWRLFKYPVRRLNEHRQDILEEMVRLRRELAPTLVFIPATGDVHQDHEVIHNEGVRAFKHTSVLGYELPWNHLSEHSSLYVTLSAADVDWKIDRTAVYKTQSSRLYSDPKYIESLARVKGTAIGQEFAESFEVIRWIA